MRKIIHIDMDAFFASVEQRDNPSLKGKPVAVGHSGERGVVSAASYEARKFGVRSAMPSVKAARICPNLIFVEGRMEVYKQVSAEIHEIFHEYTDIIEPLSLDEAFLDVTNNKMGIELAVDIAKQIKEKIRTRLNLTASAGVSYNKFLAKIASDFRKPFRLCRNNGKCICPKCSHDFFCGGFPYSADNSRSKVRQNRTYLFRQCSLKGRNGKLLPVIGMIYPVP